MNGYIIALDQGTTSSRSIVFDQKGNIICQRWFDSDGNPVLNENEFAIQRNEYDAAGMIIRRQYYSESDAPVLIKDGYFSCDYEYDQNGNGK